MLSVAFWKDDIVVFLHFREIYSLVWKLAVYEGVGVGGRRCYHWYNAERRQRGFPFSLRSILFGVKICGIWSKRSREVEGDAIGGIMERRHCGFPASSRSIFFDVKIGGIWRRSSRRRKEMLSVTLLEWRHCGFPSSSRSIFFGVKIGGIWRRRSRRRKEMLSVTTQRPRYSQLGFLRNV